MAKKNKDAAAQAGAEAAPKKSGKGKAMLLGAALVLVGAMGQKFMLSSSPAQVIIAPPVDGGVAVAASADHEIDCSSVDLAAAEEPHARRSGGGGAAAGGTADLSSMTINLADGHYLKVGITLELGDTVVAEEFSKETARAADVALNYFSTKSIDQLTSSQHAQIKLELACMMDAAYSTHGTDEAADAEVEPTVTGVLFREFLTS